MSKIWKGVIGLAALVIIFWSCEKIFAGPDTTTLETRSIKGCPTLQYTQMSDSICVFSPRFGDLYSKINSISVNNVDERITIHGKNSSSVPGVTIVNDKSGDKLTVDVGAGGIVFWSEISAPNNPGYLFFDKDKSSYISIDPAKGELVWNRKGVRKIIKFQ